MADQIKVTVTAFNTGAIDTGMYNQENNTVEVDGVIYNVVAVDNKNYVRAVSIEHF